jgi:hypothetical protein
MAGTINIFYDDNSGGVSCKTGTRLPNGGAFITIETDNGTIINIPVARIIRIEGAL